MTKEKNPESLTISGPSKFVINSEALFPRRFVIPDVCSVDLKTGEVELYIDDVSEAARQFWEAVKRIAGGTDGQK